MASVGRFETARSMVQAVLTDDTLRVAEWGWEDDDFFRLEVVEPPLDVPVPDWAVLVDKATGTIHQRSLTELGDRAKSMTQVGDWSALEE